MTDPLIVEAQLAARDKEIKRLTAEGTTLLNALQALIDAENSIESFEGDDPAYSLISVESTNFLDDAIDSAEKVIDSLGASVSGRQPPTNRTMTDEKGETECRNFVKNQL